MNREKVGFVFTGGDKGEESKQGNIAITLAHELGHGVYQIQHPWDQLNTQKTELSTNSWLMSYGQGIQLPYIHWEQISHPKFIISIFKSDASGEMATGKAKVKNDDSGELEENVTESDLTKAIDLKITPYIIAQSKHRKRMNDLGETHHDMMSGDMTDEEILKLHKFFEFQIKASKQDLIDGWKEMVKLMSMGELEEVNMRMIDKFIRNEGGEFEDEVLTNAAKKHESTARFIKNFKTNLENELKTDPYFVKKQGLVTFKIKDDERIDERRQDIVSPTLGDWLGGLGIAINDTWGYDVVINRFVIDKERKLYSLELDIEIFDHYGLDSLDVDWDKHKLFSSLTGFRSWFVLQHSKKHAHKPFITIVKFKHKLNGKY